MTDARIEAAARAMFVHSFGDGTWYSMEQDYRDIWLKTAQVALEAADAAAWIKISDKTPEDNQDVLVATNDRIVTADTFNADDDGDYFDITDDGDVTHWQPMPAPPTKEATP